VATLYSPCCKGGSPNGGCCDLVLHVALYSEFLKGFGLVAFSACFFKPFQSFSSKYVSLLKAILTSAVNCGR
jgi:hypothetical protein